MAARHGRLASLFYGRPSLSHGKLTATFGKVTIISEFQIMLTNSHDRSFLWRSYSRVRSNRRSDDQNGRGLVR
ncbi:MAG: hypothetical protein CMJ80_03695 [Planctomycetaceae bacterium]|nr:hypothetical protein [Planctomycetaceae bacterium]